MKCEFDDCDWMDDPQWIITLANVRNHMTDLLQYVSNAIAVSKAFNQ